MEPALRITALRTRTTSKYAPALRLNIERLLSTADLPPPGLPPQAVLIVRRLADPQPGRVAAGLRAGRVQAAWERAAQQRLADLQRRAARPALGPAPPDAEAVLFADESELLACLARDISLGLAGQRWWWRAWLRSAGRGRWRSGNDGWAASLAQQLMQQPHLTPAVLARLQRWNQAAALLRLLTAAQARAVLHAMLHAHGLPGLPADQPGRGVAPPPPWLSPGSPVTATMGGLGREREALLGLALDLVARPPVVASAAYQRRLQAWWRVFGPDGSALPARPAGEASFAAQPLGHSRKPAKLSSQVGFPAPDPVGYGKPAGSVGEANRASLQGLAGSGRSAESSSEAGADGRAHTVWPGPAGSHGAASAEGRNPAAWVDLATPGSETVVDAHDWPGLVEPARSGGAGDVASPDVVDMAPTQLRILSLDAASPEVMDIAPPEASLLPLLASGVPTRLGGVLYLVNLMAALDLPACCEDGWRLASGVGPWGLLHALGWELLGQEALAGDALWPALALLDGRHAHEAPGWRLPRSRPRRWPPFELPAAWLAGLEPGLDPAQSGRSWTGLGQRYRPLLARWLALALPFIDLRLRLALGLPAAASLAAGLLVLPGQLYVTATHVDLVASLEQISLPARLAGLDRDPGWLPDFGRVVTFHFT